MTDLATPLGALTARIADAHDVEVRAAWQRLQATGAVTIPFQSWQWCAALAADPRTRTGLRTVVVSDGPDVIGVLPFACLTDQRGLRVVRPPGATWLAPDHLEVVALPAARDRVAAVAVDALRQAIDHDAVDFDGVAAGSALHRALDAALRSPRYLRRPEGSDVLPYVDLTAHPADRLLSRNSRKQTRRALRDAESAGGGFTVHTHPEAITTHLVELMDLHDARFGNASAVYAGPARRAFHLRVAAALAEDGLVRLYRLATAEAAVALLYALVWGDRVLAYGGGIRPSAGTPGHALTALALTDAAQEGFAAFDLLRGDSGWKRRFASDHAEGRRLHGYVVAPQPLAWQARWLARRTVRRVRFRIDRRRS